MSKLFLTEGQNLKFMLNGGPFKRNIELVKIVPSLSNFFHLSKSEGRIYSPDRTLNISALMCISGLVIVDT